MALYRVLARSIARDCGVGEMFWVTPSLPATKAKRLRKGATATKQFISQQAEVWIASLRSQ
jgi:hypothetical protein